MKCHLFLYFSVTATTKKDRKLFTFFGEGNNENYIYWDKQATRIISLQ